MTVSGSTYSNEEKARDKSVDIRRYNYYAVTLGMTLTVVSSLNRWKQTMENKKSKDINFLPYN